MITKIVNLRVCDSDGTCFEDNPFTNTHTQGQLAGHTFTVDDIVYDHGAKARFLANDLGSVGGPAGVIWGRGGVFEFQQTWDFVKLLNALQPQHGHQHHRRGEHEQPAGDRHPRRHDSGRAPGVNTPGLLENSPAPSFDFDIKYKFPPTLVQIKNTCPFSCPARQPFIRLDDYIENPIGKTEIFNASGDILSGTGSEIIRTNILDLDALNGHIGHQSPTHANPDSVRNPIMVELIRFKHPDPAFCTGSAPCLYDFVLTADAGKDVVLDITANRRTDEALGSALTVTIAHINAGDDVDLVVNDSKNGNDTSALVLVTVNLYNPATPFYNYVYYDTYNPALGADSGPLSPCPSERLRQRQRPVRDPLPARRLGSEPGPHPARARHGRQRHRLDLRLPGRPRGRRHRHLPRLDRRRGAQVLRADRGERRDPRRHPGERGRRRATAGQDRPHRHQHGRRLERRRSHRPARRRHRDQRLADLHPHERRHHAAPSSLGDLLAGHIHSTAGDVTLYSPQRILDANRQPTIDVTGENITMNAGTRRRHRRHRASGPAVPEPPGQRPQQSHRRSGRLPRDQHRRERERRRPQGVRQHRRSGADQGHLPRRGRRRHADPHASRPHGTATT